MNFRFEALEILIDILDGDSLNEKLFLEFLNCEQLKSFMEHEQELFRKTTENSIKENIEAALEGKGGNDSYGFNYIVKYRPQIKDKISEMKNRSKELEEVILKRINRYAPLDIYDNNYTIHIYGGGCDYGFSQRSGECYINLALLADKIEFLEDIMVHEYYHSRRREGEIPPYDFSKESYLKTLMYHIMEEGVATLVQFEYEKKHNGFAFLVKRDLKKG